MERSGLSAQAVRVSFCIPALFIVALAAPPAMAVIGQIIFLSGDVRVTDQAGRTRAAARGDSIEEGDSVSTGLGASAQLRMVDETFIAVRSDTEMRFDRYRFTGKENGSENALMSLVKGGFRTITGTIGRADKSHYLVRTPAATIEARGTDHESFFIPPPAPGQIPIGNPGAYDRVNSGVTAMTTQVGVVVIGANQVAYAASQNATPTLLPSAPNFFRPTAAPVATAPAEKPEAPKPPAEKPAAVKPATPAPGAAPAPKPAPPSPVAMRDVAAVDSPARISAALALASGPSPAVAPLRPGIVAAATPTPPTRLSGPEIPRTATTLTATGDIATLDIARQEVTTEIFFWKIRTRLDIENRTLTITNTETGQSGTFHVAPGAALGPMAGLAALGTTGAVSAPTGTTGTNGSVATPAGIYPSAYAAELAANAARAAMISVGGINTALGTEAGMSAQQLFNSASASYGNTSTSETVLRDAAAIAAIAPINTALASSNLASATSAANTAASQVSAATSFYHANSGDFRDSQAAPAFAAMNSSNTLVQGAKSTVSGANAEATTQSGLLATAKSSAALLQSAATALNTAQGAFNFITGAPQVDSGATNANQSASNLLSLASAASSSAQVAADRAKGYQAAGDFEGAFAQFEIAWAEKGKAESYLALAQQIQTIAGLSNPPATLAQLRINADAAKAAGDAAVALTSSALGTVTANAATVAQLAVIAQYNNPAFATLSGFQHALAASQNTGAVQNDAAQNERIDGAGAALPNTNYVLDGQKNLVEIRDGSFQAAELGAAALLNYSHANVKFSGGTAADRFKSSDNGLYLGRWQGGTVSVDDASTGTGADLTINLGSQSAHWLIALAPAANYVQNSLSGTTTYTHLANTSPTDAAGNIGTLNSATLVADFTNQTVNAGVNATVAGKTYDMTINNMPISGNQFQGGSTSVNCAPNCAGTYSGDIQGAFARPDASAAGFRYGIWPTVASGPYTDLIRGVVAFETATPFPAAPQAAQNFATAYVYTSGVNTLASASTFEASSTSHALDGANNLTTVGDDPAASDRVRSETITGGTALIKATATSTGGSAITYGRWAGPGVSVAFADGTFSENRAVAGTYHWIKGPALSPFYLTNALTGTAAFTAQGGTVNNESGAAGTLDLANSTLNVNFTQQSVGFDIQATTGTDTWRGVGSGIRLEESGRFFAATGSTSPHSNMAVEFNGSTSGTSGVVDGILMGSGADAAGVGFAFGHAGTQFATGTVAFSGTAQSTQASYVAGIVAAGKLGSPVNTALSPTLGTATLAGLQSELAFAVQPVVNANSRTTRDGASQIYKFDMTIPVAQPTGCSSSGTSCTNVADTPATLSVRSSGYPFDAPPSPGGATPTTALANTGSDTTTGIRWGRYVGFVPYVDRIPATTGAGGNSAISSAAFDARTSNWHTIRMDAQTSKPVLPTSGTVSYTLLGGTNPSDSAGNIATGRAAATLSADFTNMTVNASVSSTVGSNAWAASASNIPIMQGTYFQARKVGSTSDNLTVTVNGSSANTAGKLTGIFTGNAATGTNGGAMMGYSLNVGGATGTTMQGVSAFKK